MYGMEPRSPKASAPRPMSAFRSPAPTPKFYEQFDSPLSTKRERFATPHYRRNLSAPRLVRTGPHPSNRLYPRRFEATKPTQISFKNIDENNLLKATKHYNIHNEELTFFEQVFSIEKQLGIGSFGEVFKSRCYDDDKYYAVKRSLEPFRNTTDRQLRLREVKNHEQLLHHRNLVTFVKAWEEKGKLYIQTEICEQSLLQYCENHHSVDEGMLWNILVDMLMAVDCLHSRELIHLDIKPDNIFMTAEDNEVVCKLGDFGLIFDLNNDEVYTAEEGDSKYLAPEVLNSHPSKAADMFSLGITILEVASDLDLPFRGVAWHDLREGRIPERFLQHLSPDMRRVILWMMNPDPKLRPSTKELLKDHAVKEHVDKRWWKHSFWATVKKLSIHAGHEVFVFVYAFFHLFVRLFRYMIECFSESKQAASQPSENVLHTPKMSRGPVVSPYVNRVPEYRVNHSFQPRHLEFEHDAFSDEENMPYGIPNQRPYTTSVHRKREPQFKPVNDHHTPHFKGILAFDNTPTSSSSSSPIPSQDDDSTPLEERLPDRLLSSASDTASDSPVSNRNCSSLINSERMTWSSGVDASGDWGHGTPSQIPMTPRRGSKIHPIAAPRFDDLNIDDDDMHITVRSCPPRSSMRETLRSRGKVPRLDFSKIEESPKSSRDHDSEKKRTLRPRRPNVGEAKRQRMVDDRGSSVDEPDF